MNQDVLQIVLLIHRFAWIGLPIHPNVKSHFDSDLYVPRYSMMVLSKWVSILHRNTHIDVD
ncbi:MAG: hypothetical protein JW776_15405 [Candidatus Lokiarchaeota archaeon]|nr:hypothetical protein [Candidatus Lokiarchaeota archaeon]